MDDDVQEAADEKAEDSYRADPKGGGIRKQMN